VAPYSNIEIEPLFVAKLLTINTVAAVWISTLSRTFAVCLWMSSFCELFEVVTTKRLFEKGFGECFTTPESNEDETNEQTFETNQTGQSENVRVLIWQSYLIEVATCWESNLLMLDLNGIVLLTC
jgi:hypothetical protein